MIYIYPIGGLCNRIRVINSGYYLAKKLNQDFTVIWDTSKNSGMTVPAEKIMIFPSDVKVIKCGDDGAFANIEYRLFRRFKYNNCDLIINDDSTLRLHSEEEILATLSPNKNIYAKTCFNLINVDYHSACMPSAEVTAKFDRVKNQLNIGRDTIGIHIRRTDQKDSINGSPTFLFENRINEILKSNPNQVFYLATDDADEERCLLQKYPQNIKVFKEKNIDRYAVEGQMDAYVELLCLAECSQIWGSYLSSYSLVASQIGESELTVLTHDSAMLNHPLYRIPFESTL